MSVVYALSSPPVKGAICVFRVSGNGCHSSISNFFKLKAFDFNKFYLRSFISDGKVVDQVGLIVFKGPHSYTGEDSFEVYGHGGLGVMSALADAFESAGFDSAPRGEFTKRAYLNNKITLDQAEAINDLVDADDFQAVVATNKNLMGSFAKEVLSFAQEIDNIRVFVEGEIDFSDEGIEFVNPSIKKDLVNFKTRFDLFRGGCVNKKMGSNKSRVVLAGPPNSGKSSVFNRLLGFNRALVSDLAGTTRDLIESEVFYNSFSFTISDSAGIRSTEDLVESAGIKKSIEEICKNDLVVFVFDDYQPQVFNSFIGLTDKRCLFVLNKCDLDKKIDKNRFDCVVSAKTGEGFDCLKDKISEVLNDVGIENEYGFFIRDRHDKLLREASDNINLSLAKLENIDEIELVAEDLKNARVCLNDIVGKKVPDSLLGDIFNSFCIGK